MTDGNRWRHYTRPKFNHPQPNLARRAVAFPGKALKRAWRTFTTIPRRCQKAKNWAYRWMQPSPPPLVLCSGDPNALTLLAPLGPRKRRLSICSPAPRSSVPRLLKRSAAQRTSEQPDCLFLRRLPPELRIQIYRYVLGDRTLHIVPCLVSSRTKPSRYSLNPQPFNTRLDYTECENSALNWRFATLINKAANPAYDAHTLCTNWTDELGNLYFQSPHVVTYHRGMLPISSQKREEVETRYNRWWTRKNRFLALLKTCRAMWVFTSY